MRWFAKNKAKQKQNKTTQQAQQKIGWNASAEKHTTKMTDYK